MKRAASIIMAVLLSATAIVSTANAAVVSVAIGDRPYYSHGAYYYRGPVRYVWAPGHSTWHYHHRAWVHGHYVRAW
ncbi:MAG TPA: hypothetical protein VGM62_16685 [Chthoniobacterales bacterium]|jgi:hypothetical protein